jgi:hypothetical protein
MSRRCHHGSARHGRPLPGPAPFRARPEWVEPKRAANGVEPDLGGHRMLPRPVASTIDVEQREPRPASVDSLMSASAIEEPELAPPQANAAPDAGARPATGREPAAPRAALIAPPHSIAPAGRITQPGPMGSQSTGEDDGADHGATGPQLRRFIKSRAYVPMHELRRRFAINGGDDEVTPVDLDRHRVFVGLPDREGRLLGELLRAGDIGYELSLDPISPIVVGVYPMRPVTRP